MNEHSRVANKTGDDHCEHCCPHVGMIIQWVHNNRAIDHVSGDPRECPGCVEHFVPCPFCERGKTLEFPSEGKGPWGTKGFWEGIRPLRQSIPILCDCNAKAAPPPPEAKEMLRGMIERLAASSRMPIEDEARRLREQEAEAIRRRRQAAEDELAAAMKPSSTATLLDDEAPESTSTLL